MEAQNEDSVQGPIPDGHAELLKSARVPECQTTGPSPEHAANVHGVAHNPAPRFTNHLEGFGLRLRGTSAVILLGTYTGIMLAYLVPWPKIPVELKHAGPVQPQKNQ